jgi:hypothetical protein
MENKLDTCLVENKAPSSDHLIKLFTLSIAVEYEIFGFRGSSFIASSHSIPSSSEPKSRSSSFSNASSFQASIFSKFTLSFGAIFVSSI